MKESYSYKNTFWYLPPRYSILVGTCLFFVVFLFYVYTLAPAVIWGDSAQYAIYAIKMDLGFGADSHPFYIILGHFFSLLPFEVAYSMNLLSAVTATMAVVCVYFIIVEITCSIFSAIAGASALCLSHAFWLHAVIAEVYDLNAFFVNIVILFLLKWRNNPDCKLYLYIAGFFFGLGLSNHLIMALTIIGFLYLAVSVDYRLFLRIKTLCTLIAFTVVGASVLIVVFFNQVQIKTVAGLVDDATGAEFKQAMLTVSFDILRDVFMYLAYLFYQYPLIGILLGFLGIIYLLKLDRCIAVSLLLIILINMLFFVSFGPGVKKTTKYTFYISDYSVFSIFIGCGFKAINDYFEQKYFISTKGTLLVYCAIILSPILLYTITPPLSKGLGVDLLKARSVPYRDNEKFFLNPNKRGYLGAARYAKEALHIASPNSIIIADYSINTVLRYYQKVKGTRKDVLIILPNSRISRDIPEETIALYYGKRDIYLADLEMGYYKIVNLKENFDFVPKGVLFQVVKKKD